MSNSLYKVTPGQASPPLASDINQYADTLNGNADVGQITLAAQISPPSIAGITATAAPGTTLSTGVFYYKFTYVVGIKKSDNTVIFGGETNGSASISVTLTTGNQTVNLAGLPTSWPATVVALRIYRTTAGAADGTQSLAATLTTPTATYNDSNALTTAIPTVNTTGTSFVLSADPTTALGAATKQYADTKVSKSGDTMTGLLVLSGDPSSALGATTKQYADTKVSKSGDTMTGDLNISTTGTNNVWSSSLFFFSKNSSGTTIGSNIQTDANGSMRLNTYTSSGSNGIVFTKSHTLDDGNSNIKVGGSYPIFLTGTGLPNGANRGNGAIGAYGDGLGVQSSTNAGTNSNVMFTVRTNDGVEYFNVSNGGAVKVGGSNVLTTGYVSPNIITLEAPSTSYYTTSTTGGNVTVSIDGVTGTINLQFHKANWSAAFASGRSVYFEAVADATGGTGYAALGTQNNGNQGQVTFAGSGANRQRSGAVTILDGSDIWVTMWVGSGTLRLYAARLIIL